MTCSQQARRPARRIRIRWIRVVCLLVVIAAIAAALGSRSRTHSPHFAAAPPAHRPHGERAAALGEAGGALPGGTTVFDGTAPGIANLDPGLLRALRAAATAAATDGVELVVNSGWRSPAYEDGLRSQAIARYGSEAEAARWVATGTTSPHVAGDAVDIGPAGATQWLAAHGAAYGLCQIYGNEPWHYELRPDAVSEGCPGMYADPTQDPRMKEQR